MEAARLLGAPLSRRIREVALPLARPAVAAGVALALMETLADFGVASYFGIQTFTAGIYKAWLVMDNRIAAAQLATVLLGTVALLLWVEHRAQQRLRFATLRGQRAGSADAQPARLHGGKVLLAWLVCGLPVLFGFVLPVLFMLRPLLGGWDELPWSSFVQWSRNSVWLLEPVGGLGHCAGAGAGLRGAGLAFCLDPRRCAAHGSGLRRAGRGDRGGPAAASGLAAGGLARQRRGLLGHGHRAGHRLGLSGALHRGGACNRCKAVTPVCPTSLDDSARMLGATGFALAWRVHAPLLKRSVIAGALLVFVDVMKELPATLVLASVQQRHPGRGDLPARAGRTAG